MRLRECCVVMVPYTSSIFSRGWPIVLDAVMIVGTEERTAPVGYLVGFPPPVGKVESVEVVVAGEVVRVPAECVRARDGGSFCWE